MGDDSNPAPHDAKSRRPLQALLSTATSLTGILVASATALGACLHLTGHVAHIKELAGLGVPSDFFPRGVEWTMINGYYAAFLEWTRTLDDMPWGLLTLAFLLLAYGIWFYRLPNLDKRPAWIDRRPKWLREIITALVASGATLAVCFYLLFLVSLVAIVPGYIGESAGQHSAEQKIALYRSTPPSKAPDELWRDGEPVMRGHVIAVSTEMIAFYDSAQGVSRVVDRKGVELRARPRTQ
jgi:hypothetical protein